MKTTPKQKAALQNLNGASLGTLRALARRGLVTLKVSTVRRMRAWGKGPVETTVDVVLTDAGRREVAA